MKIPEKIHFAGFDYDVEIIEDLDGNESWGRSTITKQKIFIEKDMAPNKQFETLIHELIHIAYRHTFNEMDSNKEEKRMKAWSLNIYGILKDNNLIK